MFICPILHGGFDVLHTATRKDKIWIHRCMYRRRSMVLKDFTTFAELFLYIKGLEAHRRLPRLDTRSG